MAVVEFEKQGPLAWIVFDHAARRNAITAAMWSEIPRVALALDADPEVRALIAEQIDGDLDPLLERGYSADKARKLRGIEIDVDAVASRGLGYERLDQLLIEHLLGIRSA